MPTPTKILVVSVVSAMTFTLVAAPAVAVPPLTAQFSPAASVQPAGSQQTLNANANSLETQALDSLLKFAEYGDAAHGFDVKAAIERAESEIGTSRPTGWDAPGECISSVFRWLGAGGVKPTNGGNPVDNYRGALRLTPNNAKAGDVIQYEHLTYPTSWVTGVHTVLVTGVNADGTLNIIESNVPYGSGLVSEVKNWTPEPPAGFQAVVWRF